MTVLEIIAVVLGLSVLIGVSMGLAVLSCLAMFMAGDAIAKWFRGRARDAATEES